MNQELIREIEDWAECCAMQIIIGEFELSSLNVRGFLFSKVGVGSVHLDEATKLFNLLVEKYVVNMTTIAE